MIETETNVSVVSWPTFTAQFSNDWRQGEHVTILGATGMGKSALAFSILPIRKYVCVIATKPNDPLIDDAKGYQVTRQWPVDFQLFPRVVFWPKIASIDDVAEQRGAVNRVLYNIYTSGGWCVYIDETRYVAESPLKLAKALEMLWLQGRSNNVSLVATSQRPAWVPLEAYSQATHLFMFRESDKRNLARLGEIGGVDTEQIVYAVRRLPVHDALYVNTRTGELCNVNIRRDT